MTEVAQDMQIQISKTFSKYKFLLHGFTTCFARSSQIHTFIGGYVTLFLDCKDSNFGSAKMGSGSVEVLLVTGRIQVQIPILPEKNCITKPLSSVTGLHSSSLMSYSARINCTKTRETVKMCTICIDRNSFL